MQNDTYFGEMENRSINTLKYGCFNQCRIAKKLAPNPDPKYKLHRGKMGNNSGCIKIRMTTVAMQVLR